MGPRDPAVFSAVAVLVASLASPRIPSLRAARKAWLYWSMGKDQRCAAAVIGIALLLSCSVASSRAVEESLTLEVGEAARFESSGLTLRFEEVVSDSRCPKDVDCIQAGEAVVRFTARMEEGEDQPLRFRVPPGGSASLPYRDLRVTIQKLEPEPESGKRIEPSAYRATVSVGDP